MTKMKKAPTTPEPAAGDRVKFEVIAAAVQLLLRARDLEDSEEYKELVEVFGEFASNTYIGSME